MFLSEAFLEKDLYRQFVYHVYNKWKIGKNEILKEASQYMTTKEIGDDGEAFVKEKFESLNLETFYSPYSRTPADVWGFTFKNDIQYILLSQVKSSIKGVPAGLNQEDGEIMDKFIDFVKAEFETSECTESIRGRQIILAIGYVGVSLDKNPKIITSEAIACNFSDSLEKSKVRDEIQRFYNKLI